MKAISRLPRHARGVTLIELLIVLVILVGIGGILATTISRDVKVRGVDGVSRDAPEVVTLATMRTVSAALVGSSLTEPGYREDLGSLPTRLGGLIENIDGEPEPYDPASKRGWRGPYVADVGSRYGTYVEAGDSFPADPDTDPAVLDGWGKPLVLQQPGTDDARVVSAGPNRVLETDPGNPLDIDRGDDLILFLLTTDPNL